SLIRSSNLYVEWVANAASNDTKSARNDNRLMGEALRQVPPGTRQIYVLPAGGLQDANPEYLRLVLGVPAEIVRVADIYWNCGKSGDSVAFDHSNADGVVSMTVTLPDCAYFRFA